jgi:hypothetical protein
MQRFLTLCTLVVVGFVLLMREPTVAQQQANAVPKWEYKFMRDLDHANLNGMGAEGWELVSVCKTDVPHSYLFALKRPL